MTARRELAAAVLGSALAGALALVAGGQAWVRSVAERPAPLPPVESTISGGEVAPLVPAAGLVLLAAAVALIAVQGLARMAVGVLVAVAGGVLVWSGARVRAAGLHPAVARAVDVELADVWPVLAAGAGVLAGVVGVLVVLRGGRWPAMGDRYERPGAEIRPVAAQRSEDDRVQDAWKALDRGEDPTDVETAAPRTPPA